MKQTKDILPFSRSYWVAPKKLLAGFTLGSLSNQKSLLKLSGLSRVGIAHIINLIESDESTTDNIKIDQYEDILNEYNSFTHVPLTYERLSIRDMNIPLEERMKEILDSIDANNEGGKSVYVHCHGGFGRTGTVVGCYLKRHKLATNDNVFDMINHLRRNEEMAHRPSPQRQTQCEFILNWNE